MLIVLILTQKNLQLLMLHYLMDCIEFDKGLLTVLKFS
jgi:hypothetical protein